MYFIFIYIIIIKNLSNNKKKLSKNIIKFFIYINNKVIFILSIKILYKIYYNIFLEIQFFKKILKIYLKIKQEFKFFKLY